MQNADLVVVGLGNPGVKYKNTLHNAGYKVIERLADNHGWKWKEEKKFQSEVAKGTLRVEYHLIKPLTFMNLSGMAVKSYLDYFQLTPEQLVVVCDDADLPLGELKLKPQGGSGGHNGLKSLIKELGTDDFKRLRFGIGRSTPLAEYVLTPQSGALWDALDKRIVFASDCLARLSNESFEAVMKMINSGEKE